MMTAPPRGQQTVERRLSDPDRHAKTARALSQKYVNSSNVLTRLREAEVG
jgi:hypothetical protein